MKKHLFFFLVFVCPIFLFSQNVGIGITSPLKKFHIQSGGTPLLTSAFGDGMLFSTNSISGARIFMENLGGAIGQKSIALVNENVGGQGTTYFGSLSDDGSIWIKNAILSMTHSSGNVGIGLSSPSAKLEVEGGIKADSIDVQSGLIKNVADPISAQDAATKAYVDLISSPCVLSIGDTHEGGIIFYLDGSGCHGLVAKATDEPVTYQWSTSYNNTYAYAAGIYGGAQNTKKIIYRMGVGNAPAAEQCEGLTDGGFTDWYLPSKDELDMMFVNLQLQSLGGFSGFYWSSIEDDNYFAWSQGFYSDGALGASAKNNFLHVRAVRAF